MMGADEPEALRTSEVPAVGNPTFDASATHELTLPAGQDLAPLLQEGCEPAFLLDFTFIGGAPGCTCS